MKDGRVSRDYISSYQGRGRQDCQLCGSHLRQQLLTESDHIRHGDPCGEWSVSTGTMQPSARGRPSPSAHSSGDVSTSALWRDLEQPSWHGNSSREGHISMESAMSPIHWEGFKRSKILCEKHLHSYHLTSMNAAIEVYNWIFQLRLVSVKFIVLASGPSATTSHVQITQCTIYTVTLLAAGSIMLQFDPCTTLNVNHQKLTSYWRFYECYSGDKCHLTLIFNLALKCHLIIE